MKIIDASAGVLTNFEVLDFLRNKSNSAIEDEKLAQTTIAKSEDDQSDRIKRNLTLVEMKVYEYLVQTAARDQTRECVNEFLQRCKKYEFAQADIVSILNIRPSTPSATVELYSIVESFFERFEDQVDEIVQMIEDILPPRPVTKKGGDEEVELAPLETSNQMNANASTESQKDTPPPDPITEG